MESACISLFIIMFPSMSCPHGYIEAKLIRPFPCDCVQLQLKWTLLTRYCLTLRMTSEYKLSVALNKINYCMRLSSASHLDSTLPSSHHQIEHNTEFHVVSNYEVTMYQFPTDILTLLLTLKKTKLKSTFCFLERSSKNFSLSLEHFLEIIDVREEIQVTVLLTCSRFR